MARWDFELNKNIALALRDAIRNEDLEAICATLQMAYQEINGICPEYYDDNDLMWDIEDLDYLDVDGEGAEDEIDYELSRFYDLCDALKIWIPVN